MKKAFGIAAALFVGGFAALLIVYPEPAADGVRNGLSMCYTALIPALFPFIFVTAFLSPLLTPRRRGRALPAVLFALGLTGGFAGCAAAVGALRQRRAIDSKSAARLMCCCVNAGPAFLISCVGLCFLSSRTAGMMLFCALSLSSLVCGLIFGSFAPLDVAAVEEEFNVIRSFTQSVTAAVRTTAALCGFSVLFSCVLNIAFYLLPFRIPVLAAAILLEVTSACSIAGEMRGGIYFCALAVSLCGLSVISQIKMLLGDVSLRPFFLSRLLHAPMSLLFVHILSLLCFTETVEAFAPSAAALFSVSPPFAFFLFLCAAIFVLSTPDACQNRKSGI